MIGLGCMRLSTAADRDPERAIAVIHAALDAGVTLLDTADAYAHDDTEIGHNERLIAEALRTWGGDRETVEVATKGGLRRPGGRWVPDGRAKHLRAACEASLKALGVAAIDLYQLHVVDPRTALETSVRALAALQQDGLVRRVGLCNVTVGQIVAARAIVDIDAVQVGMSPFDDAALRNGVAEYCRDEGIRLIAWRPLGGERAGRLDKDTALKRIARRHETTVHEIVLAWLCDLAPDLVPIPGATRVETAASLARVRDLRLDDQDRAQLDAHFPAGRLLRIPRAERRPADDAPGEVVLVLGMPGAGKTTAALELADAGYARLNRDERGGRLADLVDALDEGFAAGGRRWVLDNTYPSRSTRGDVIECAWRHGVPVRCVQVDTPLAEAQINAVERLIERYGRLPMPEELRADGRTDHRCFGPDAQFRWERQFEPPVLEEGYTAIDRRAFVRRARPDFDTAAVILEVDDILCASASGAAVALDPDDVMVPDAGRALVREHITQGLLPLAIAWRPQIETGETNVERVAESFARLRAELGIDLDIAHCPHRAGPPVCWCRKPLPGLILEFRARYRLDLTRSVLVGRSAADRTMADRLGMRFVDTAASGD